MGLKNLLGKKKRSEPLEPAPFSFPKKPEPLSKPLPKTLSSGPSLPSLKEEVSKPKPAIPQPSSVRGDKFEDKKVGGSHAPHLFVKVTKYEEVRDSTKKLGDKLKEVVSVLDRLESLKEEEVKRVEELKKIVKRMHELSSKIDSVFKEAKVE